MGKTLYISDLDGTLLGKDIKVSEYTAGVIGGFIRGGGLFSYATARSFLSAGKLTQALDIQLPVVCYNGSFIVDGKTGELLMMQRFSDEEVRHVRNVLNERGVYPIVYALVDGVEKFSYIDKYVTPQMRVMLNERKGDPRERVAETPEELYAGQVFCFVCIGGLSEIAAVDGKFKNDGRFYSIYSRLLAKLHSGAFPANFPP